MKKGIEIKTNGRVIEVKIDGLKDMQKTVDGNIECTLTGKTSDDEGWDLWANEEGRLLELPMNQVARVFIAEVKQIPIQNVLSLHGDFLLLGSDYNTGETTSCPQEIADIALSMDMFSEPMVVLTDDEGNKKVMTR